MGYEKLQVGRATAMDTLLSDTENTVNLDNPITLTSGTLTAGTTGVTVVAAAATFITDGVQVGDLVVNQSSTPNASRVVSVDSETQLTVQTTGLFASGNTVQILSGTTEPAVLYVGTTPGSGAVTLKVVTEGGDEVVFHNPAAGSFLPVQVKRVYDTLTTVSNIVALF